MGTLTCHECSSDSVEASGEDSDSLLSQVTCVKIILKHTLGKQDMLKSEMGTKVDVSNSLSHITYVGSIVYIPTSYS